MILTELSFFPGVAQHEVKVSITPSPSAGYPNMTAHWRFLPICQGLADEEEVPPLLPGPFGPIGWNGWGEKTAQEVRNRISSVLSQFWVSSRRGVTATSASSLAYLILLLLIYIGSEDL